MIVEVALPVPLFKTFDYLIPPELGLKNPHELIGCRVLVPFGFKPSIGLIIDVKETSDAPPEKLKTISRLIDAAPVLTPELMELGRWISAETLSSPGESFFALLPRRVSS